MMIIVYNATLMYIDECLTLLLASWEWENIVYIL